MMPSLHVSFLLACRKSTPSLLVYTDEINCYVQSQKKPYSEREEGRWERQFP